MMSELTLKSLKNMSLQHWDKEIQFDMYCLMNVHRCMSTDKHDKQGSKIYL